MVLASFSVLFSIFRERGGLTVYQGVFLESFLELLGKHLSGNSKFLF